MTDRPMRVATFRWIHDDFVGTALPLLVLEETADRIVSFQPGGTSMMKATGRRGGPNNRNLLADGHDGGFEEKTWTGEGVLRVYRPGDEWSTWRWLGEDGTWSAHYYVNLEAPWVPTSIGFDSADWILDVIRNADGSWSYKDEDELEWAEQSGHYSAAHVLRIRDAGRRAVAAIESRQWPFEADWDVWLPLAELPVPTLDDAWNQ